MNDRLKEALALRYSIELIPDPDGGFVARHPDLPGCVGQGETPDEAVGALDHARASWIEARLRANLAVPVPTIDEEFSGKFLVRLPRSVHGQLVRLAAKENISLNQLVSTVLARHLGAAPGEAILEFVTQQLDQRLNDISLAVLRRRGIAHRLRTRVSAWKA